MSAIECKNCNHEYVGNFCPQCGQSSHEERINVAYFLHEIPHSVFHIDKGFFYTLSKLFAKPGPALKEYLAGKRVKHYKPFAFVLIMSTICTLLIKGLNHLININYEKNNLGKALNFGEGFFVKYPSILIFIMIPILALITWLFFRKRAYNYWEHFLINTYLAAYLNVFLLVVRLFQCIQYYFTNRLSVNFIYFMFFFMFYYGYTFGGLMSDKKKILQNIILISFMNFFLAFIYIAAFTLTGITAPWWEN